MTPRQHQLLGYLRDYIASNDFAPTYAEMARALNIRSRSSLFAMVQHLLDDGHLVHIRRSGKNRAIGLADKLTGISSQDLRAELIRRGEYLA